MESRWCDSRAIATANWAANTAQWAAAAIDQQGDPAAGRDRTSCSHRPPVPRRVARPGAVLGGYGYNWFYLSPQLDPLVDQWLLRPIEPYWLPNLRLLWHGYRTIDFPFEEITEPRLALYLSWNLDQLLNYCRTWSATRSKIAAEGEQFLAAARDALAGVWGNPELRRTVVMPITARLGRVR